MQASAPLPEKTFLNNGLSGVRFHTGPFIGTKSDQGGSSGRLVGAVEESRAQSLDDGEAEGDLL